MISCQTDRLRPTMAGGTTNCVTDMFMAHLRVAQSNRESPATLICFLRLQRGIKMPTALVADCAANRGPSPWDRSEFVLNRGVWRPRTHGPADPGARSPPAA